MVSEKEKQRMKEYYKNNKDYFKKYYEQHRKGTQEEKKRLREYYDRVKRKHQCSTCKFSERDYYRDYTCRNEDGRYYSDIVEYNFYCPLWKGKRRK